MSQPPITFSLEQVGTPREANQSPPGGPVPTHPSGPASATFATHRLQNIVCMIHFLGNLQIRCRGAKHYNTTSKCW